ADVPPRSQEEQHGHEPGEHLRQQSALNFPCVADAMFLQLAGDVLIDSGGDELLLPARQRLLQCALQITFGDGDIFDLVLLEQLLELAIGDRRDLVEVRKKILDQQHDKDRRDGKSDIEVCPENSPSRTLWVLLSSKTAGVLPLPSSRPPDGRQGR